MTPRVGCPIGTIMAPNTPRKMVTGIKSKPIIGLTPPRRYPSAFGTTLPCTIAPITELWDLIIPMRLNPGKEANTTGKIVTYDHMHKSASDKGTSYAFSSVQQLIEDFFNEVNRILKEVSK